ncbi:hypothetical protein Aduo_003424 [Ancylostoma duodenale]
MSAASVASVYSSSEAEECINLGNADDLRDCQENSLRTAVSGDSSEAELNTAFEEEYLVTAPSTLFSSHSSHDSVSARERDGNVKLDDSMMATAVTGSISWYSMPPSETTVEVPTRTENEPATEVVEKLRHITETANSVKVQRPKFECQIPATEVIEKLRYHTETANSVEVQKAKLGCQIPAIEVIEKLRYHTETANSVGIQKAKLGCQREEPIKEVIEGLRYRVEISSSNKIEKPLLYCCQFLEDFSLNDPAQALGDQHLESSEYDTAIEA